jgi:hypothetical protein
MCLLAVSSDIYRLDTIMAAVSAERKRKRITQDHRDW